MKNTISRNRLYMLIVSVVIVGGCTNPMKRTWSEYRAAKKRGDYEAAKKYLAGDARIWHGNKEGPGKPLTVKGGPWRFWDEEFRATSISEQPQISDRTLTYIYTENNDYYRLVDRSPSKARITYYFNDKDKISGILISRIKQDKNYSHGRFDEFEQWANKKYPGLLDTPEMDMPNQPKRWRELLTEWRVDTGLQPIDE